MATEQVGSVTGEVAGSTSEESSEVFFQDPNKSFFDIEAEEKAAAVVRDETEEVAEPEATEAPTAKGLSKEDQSFKDRYYAELDKRQALERRLLESDRGQPSTQATVTDEADIVQRAKEEWGEDSVQVELAKELKRQREALNQISQTESQTTAQKTLSIMEEFVAAHPELLSNEALKVKFLEDFDDRFDSTSYGDLYQRAITGKKIEPSVLNSLKGKLERSFASVTTKKTDATRKENADKRVELRAGRPVGVTPSPEKVNPDEGKEMSYREARDAARGRSR